MGDTNLTFWDEYYKSGVDPDPDQQGLRIGGFEPAFLADLKATYIFEKLHHLLQRQACFIGMYHGDKLIVFHGQQSND